MSNTTEDKNTDFVNLYNKSYRLAAAVFTISNIIDEKEELRTKIKKLSLEVVSMAVQLKDINFYDAKKLISDIEKNALELMSLLDIASLAGLISKMNASILKEEFQSFIVELNLFAGKFEANKNTSVKGIFAENLLKENNKILIDQNISVASKQDIIVNKNTFSTADQVLENNIKSDNGHKRKDLRKNAVLDFIKRHKNASIKDIAPNIIGCSEKTVQRELIQLINEGKIRKIGERRWSKYYVN